MARDWGVRLKLILELTPTVPKTNDQMAADAQRFKQELEQRALMGNRGGYRVSAFTVQRGKKP